MIPPFPDVPVTNVSELHPLLRAFLGLVNLIADLQGSQSECSISVDDIIWFSEAAIIINIPTIYRLTVLHIFVNTW